jgi:phosphoribosylglycinamide formyltransferase-1
LDRNIQIGALISGGGTNLQAIIDACQRTQISGQMVFVGSDTPGAGGLERARRNDIATFVVDYKSIIREFKNDPQKAALPDDFDLDELLAKHLVLAGFMRNLTPYFIDRVNTDRHRLRIMNIHPALLPAFAGVDGYGDTFRYGCKVGGCTVHFIDYGEDTGPIIGQRAFPIEPDDSLESIRKKGLEIEWELYPHCIQLFAQGRIKVVRRSFDLGGGKKNSRKVVVIEDLKKTER